MIYIVLQIVIGIIAALGIGFVLADVFKLPSLKATKAASNLGKKGNKKTSSLEVYLKDLSGKISKIIKLNAIRKAELEMDLRTAGMDLTPEQYIAEAIVKAGLFALLSIPAFFILPLVGGLIVGISIFVLIRETKSVSRKIRKKREEIEYELPRFVGHIEKILSHSRDLVYVIESYIPSAGPVFKQELMMTLADMRSTGDNQKALEALDSRIGSNNLSEVTMALISVENTTDTELMWATLSMKFSELQKLKLKEQANGIPRKMKKLSMALMFCFLLMYAAVIGQVLMSSLNTLF